MSDGHASGSRQVADVEEDTPSITTWIPQRPHQNVSDEMQGGATDARRDGPSMLWPTRAHLRLEMKRRRALAHLLSDWEGRDCILQFLQSLLLLAYTLAPQVILLPHHRKRLHITSEAIASVRRLIIAARWISEVLQGVSAARKGKTKARPYEDLHKSTLASRELSARYNTQQDVATLTRRAQVSVGTVAELLSKTAEACELAAFAGGSSIIWRVAGGNLGARQRRGLERIALTLSLASLLLAMRKLERSRRAIVAKLRAANARLLLLTDRVHADDDAQTLLRGHKLSAEQALSASDRQVPVSTPSEKDTSSIIDKELRQAEAAVRTCRRRLYLLRLERGASRAELPFMIMELFLPRIDHTRIEAWCGLIASLCHMSRHARSHDWGVSVD